MRVYLRTFGCRANHYDSEAVRDLLQRSGHEMVASSSDADVAVFNSCAVTADAEAELRKVVRRAARERPELRSVVMGCAAALDDDRPANLKVSALPSVEHVVPAADLVTLAKVLELPTAVGPVLTTVQSGTRAVLRIQDGCDEHCTFCATTLARGANKSRPIRDLVREAEHLAGRHAEIVLTGIHIGSYGNDTGSSLGKLVEQLVLEVPVVRFRLSSIEATEIDERLAALLVSAPERVAPHVHAPLQSASNTLLRRMGRHWYRAETYARAVQDLAARMPVLGLGADIITGFPGETDADHAATLALVDELPFTYLHVFPYSERPGTSAIKMRDKVAPAVADARAAELRALGEQKAAAYRAARVGGRADVVVIGRSDQREGLTGDYLTVAFDGTAPPRGARVSRTLTLRGDGQLAVQGANQA